MLNLEMCLQCICNAVYCWETTDDVNTSYGVDINQ